MSYKPMLMKDYKVEHEGKIHTFKELCNAFKFCDDNGLLYPQRIWEPDGQPQIRALLITGGEIKKNRQRIIANAKEARENEIKLQARS